MRSQCLQVRTPRPSPLPVWTGRGCYSRSVRVSRCTPVRGISLLSSLRSISLTPGFSLVGGRRTAAPSRFNGFFNRGKPVKTGQRPTMTGSTRLKPGADERCSKNGMRLCLGQLAPDAGAISPAKRASTRAVPGRSSTDIAPPAGHEERPAHRNACREPAGHPPAACSDACDCSEGDGA